MKKGSAVRALSARGFKFGIVVSRFNPQITDRLLKGALRALKRQGAANGTVTVQEVPGAFEIPSALQQLARRRGRLKLDALIALGAVIRGETPHFEFVASGAAHGVMEVSLTERIPIAFGVLTTNNVRQAVDRSGGRRGDKGKEAALTAIEMAHLSRRG